MYKWKYCKENFVRKRLRKRKRGDVSEENSDDGRVTKGSNSTAKSSMNENRTTDHDTINISDDDENRNDVREPSSQVCSIQPNMEPKKIERPQTFKSVREYFGKDEAVYIMDAKTTGNIGRYLNVSQLSIIPIVIHICEL